MRGLEDMMGDPRCDVGRAKLYAEFNGQKKHINFEHWLIEELNQARSQLRRQRAARKFKEGADYRA